MLKSVAIAFGISSLLFLSSVEGVRAQVAIDPEKQALIQELMTLTQADKMSDRVMSMMLAQMEQQLPKIISSSLPNLPGQDPKQSQQKTLEIAKRILDRYRQLLPQRIDLAKYTREISYSIYSKYFNESELQDLVSFYRSTTGQKTIQVMPQILTESMQEFNDKLMPEMMKIMSEIMQEEMKTIPRN